MSACPNSADPRTLIPLPDEARIMRQVRFRDPDDDVRYGEWTDAGTIHADPKREGRVTDETETLDSESVDVIPPCEPSKIVCIGLNYADHAAEQGMDVPDRPLLFLKTPNAVASHGSTVELLPDKERLEYEAELGVVVGRTCRNIETGTVDDVVAGYLPVIDMTAEDILQRNPRFLTRAKSFDTFLIPGPTIAVPEGSPDLSSVSVRTEVNGETKAENRVANMLFPPAEIVAFHAGVMTLQPGDLFSTGTPGAAPINPGDEVRAVVESVGSVEAPVTR